MSGISDFLFPGTHYTLGRVDQGQDFQTKPGQAIIAPGSGYVVGVGSDPSGFGPAYPIVHFTSGAYKGLTLYLGHILANVKSGQLFKAGAVLGHTGTSPVGNAGVPGWGEIGLAPGGNPGPMGQPLPWNPSAAAPAPASPPATARGSSAPATGSGGSAASAAGCLPAALTIFASGTCILVGLVLHFL